MSPRQLGPSLPGSPKDLRLFSFGGCPGLGWVEGKVEPEGCLWLGAEDLRFPEMNFVPGQFQVNFH